MAPSKRDRFAVAVTIGYLGFASIWIVLTDRTVAILADPASQAWFATAKGLTFVAVTALLLFFALRTVPPEEDAGIPFLKGWTFHWRSTLVALLPPLVVFALQFMFWTEPQPYVWFLFFPAVFFSSWHAYPVNTYTHYMLDVSSRQNKARHRSALRPRLRFPAMI